MSTMLRYCARSFSEAELNIIRRLIADNPDARRAKLSRLVCEQLQWVRPNGLLKDMSCRVAMIRMQKDGLIKLPAPRHRNGNGKIRIIRTRQTAPQSLFCTPAGALEDLRLEIVRPGEPSKLWNEYIDRYHYLGYHPLPGAQLRYFAKTQNRIIALLGFGAAAWQTAPRDQFIGWNHQQRCKNLHLVINCARFLILPWVQSKNSASKLLSMASHKIRDDWHLRYQYEPLLLETFVDTERLRYVS